MVTSRRSPGPQEGFVGEKACRLEKVSALNLIPSDVAVTCVRFLCDTSEKLPR